MVEPLRELVEIAGSLNESHRDTLLGFARELRLREDTPSGHEAAFDADEWSRWLDANQVRGVAALSHEMERLRAAGILDGEGNRRLPHLPSDMDPSSKVSVAT